MIGLELRFLSGRFHGNGWYHAHNECIPEWPPSPWRVLRALVSAACAEDLSVTDIEPLIEKLRELPRYRLPRAVDAHTRHYMPDTDDANHKKAKVFDAFVAVEGGAREPQPLVIGWAGSLTTDELALLVRLCRRVSYLGRAESWAEVRVVDISDGQWDCWPDEGDQRMTATSLLAPTSAAALSEWRDGQPKPKKGPEVPRNLWDVLTFDGKRYRSEGWSSMPGTRLVRYVFAHPPFRRSVESSSGKSVSYRPTVARFAIRSAVLPRLYEAVSIGERLRMSAMSQSKDVSGDARPVFSGHGPKVTNHGHAMYLCTSEDPVNVKRGVIDHLLITAREGFDQHDVVALQRLRRLWARRGHDLELILTGLGRLEDYAGTTAPRVRVLAESQVWESVTPFVPVRHPKRVRGVHVDTIADQLRLGCEQLLGVRPIEVSAFGDPAHWFSFRRRRTTGSGRRGPDLAFGARLVFDRPVRGPIALGFGAHFGLGLFSAVASSSRQGI